MSTHNLRKYLDLLTEADLVPPNTNVALPSLGTFNNDQAIAAALAQENRCAKCGTPQAQHTGLKHAFAAEPVAPGGGGIARIKQLQQELKAAGAPLGATGAGRDGIDGALGPLTRAAAAKNPIIAAKYSDVLGTETATPASQATISQLTTALDTIEQILAKYKVKMSESRSVAKPDQMASWRDLMEAGPRSAAQQASMQTAATGINPPNNPFGLTPGGAARAMSNTQAVGKVAGKGLLKGAAGTVGRALPGIGAVLSAQDAYDRYQKGDYAGAGIAGAAGLASLIPVWGWAASLGINAVNLAKDAANDPKINISPEDAAVLDQNLKAIQDLSKDPAVAAAITPEIRARLERVIKAAATVIVADTPADGGQSATPVAAPDDLVKSVDGIEKILTKYQFEDVELANNVDVMTEHELRSFVLKNMHLLSESEQMAIRRDIMSEGIPPSWVAKAAQKLAPKAKAGWDAATKASADAADAAKTAAEKIAKAKAKEPTGTLKAADSIGYKANQAWNTTKSVANTAYTTAKYATLGWVAYTANEIYNIAKDAKNSADELMSDDNSYLSDADKAELGQHAAVLEKYLKTPEDAAKLPPEIQQRLAAINTRMKKLVAAGVDR